jgi:hypothetical protein
MLIAALALTGCNAGPAGSELTGEERDAVLQYAEPMTDNVLQSMINDDYASFSRDFNEKMMQSLSVENFPGMRKQIDGLYGAYQSRQVDKVMDYGQVVTVIYKGSFAKKDGTQILITFDKAEPHKIAGLFFR